MYNKWDFIKYVFCGRYINILIILVDNKINKISISNIIFLAHINNFISIIYIKGVFGNLMVTVLFSKYCKIPSSPLEKK